MLTEAERKEAEANLRRYLEIAVEVGQQAPTGAGVDRPENPTTMKERSNEHLKS